MSDRPDAISGYGMWVFYCSCGWITASRHGVASKVVKPECCEACGIKPRQEPVTTTSAVEWREDVGALICHISDIRSERLWKYARGHGYCVYQMSPRKYVVLRQSTANIVKFEGDDKSTRAYVFMSKEYGPENYQMVMNWLKDQIPELPEYLAR